VLAPAVCISYNTMPHVMLQALLLMHAKEAHVIEMQERTEQLFVHFGECLCG